MANEGNYVKREWLNGDMSYSTGSVVSYHGKSSDPYLDHKKEPTETHIMYLEISDCHHKVKLHRAYQDTPEEFIEKLKKLRMHIDDFITFLEEEHGY